MGHNIDTAVTVWGFQKEAVAECHAKASALFVGLAPVSAVHETPVNGYLTFAVFPSGSKAWWPHWEQENAAREAFKAWLLDAWTRHLFLSWCEVIIHEDGQQPARVVEHNHTEITAEGDERYVRAKPGDTLAKAEAEITRLRKLCGEAREEMEQLHCERGICSYCQRGDCSVMPVVERLRKAESGAT